ATNPIKNPLLNIAANLGFSSLFSNCLDRITSPFEKSLGIDKEENPTTQEGKIYQTALNATKFVAPWVLTSSIAKPFLAVTIPILLSTGLYAGYKERRAEQQRCTDMMNTHVQNIQHYGPMPQEG
ncbi:MAG: hypothetical protein AAF621_07435, partial [Pseudomonadota bacterium]